MFIHRKPIMIPSTINVRVTCQEHCNLDSFPLRFGFSFKENKTIIIKRQSIAEQVKYHKNRWKFEGSMIHPNTNRIESATFVVLKTGNDYKMITAWCNNQDTEFYLSEVMKSLRKSGELSVSDLINFHPQYIKGDLREHADLVLALSVNKTSYEVNRIKKQSDETILKVRGEFNKLQLENKELKNENDNLKKLLDKERENALQTNNLVTETKPNTLITVRTEVFFRGSSCTVLTLQDGQKWHMKTSTFDPSGSITQQAISLIGKQVVITSWDPVRQPGKWSLQGYFRNVYAA